MNKKLKPCPFCGSEEIVIKNIGDYKYCICNNCKSSTNVELTATKAITEWNRRVSDED